MRKLSSRIVVLAILLLAGCAQGGQSPGTPQQSKPWDSDVGAGQM